MNQKSYRSKTKRLPFSFWFVLELTYPLTCCEVQRPTDSLQHGTLWPLQVRKAVMSVIVHRNHIRYLLRTLDLLSDSLIQHPTKGRHVGRGQDSHAKVLVLFVLVCLPGPHKSVHTSGCYFLVQLIFVMWWKCVGTRIHAATTKCLHIRVIIPRFEAREQMTSSPELANSCVVLFPLISLSCELSSNGMKNSWSSANVSAEQTTNSECCLSYFAQLRGSASVTGHVGCGKLWARLGLTDFCTGMDF